MNFNRDFSELTENYLFADIANRVSRYEFLHPEKRILKLGIGDVTLPLPPSVIRAFKSAAEEMGDINAFRGYLPYEGCEFLRESVKNYYKSMGVELSADEIFISDGAKSDLGNLPDLFGRGSVVLVPEPVYPVYVEANVIAGNRVVYAVADEGNGFLPMPDLRVDADLIYLCSPNNPTGAAYTPGQLKEWVAYAEKKGAVIIYDAAYERFVQDSRLARSIFQAEGAKHCAIEVCSLSKTAGFTGMRCGYTVIPKELERHGVNANKLWYRRQSAKFNGVSYAVQRAAEAVFSEEGQLEIQKNVDYYLQNAKVISTALKDKKISFWGGENSPYIWLKCPGGMTGWQFFDYLLNGARVVGTPGAGFGKGGEEYFRLTAFSSAEVTRAAVEGIAKLL